MFGGTGVVDHSDFAMILKELEASGGFDLSDHESDLRAYAREISDSDPAELSRDEALAFWINLYNAGALALAGEAQRKGEGSVLRVPGAFTAPFVAVSGESVSLDAIEHAKIRRFGDPRIHSALVCGSVSCPTLRSAPYTGADLDGQLENQMRSFLDSVGSRMRGDGTLELSRVFLWYGSDFVRPNRMPTFVPSSRSKVAEAVSPWLSHPVGTTTSIEFQGYDWGLRCSVGSD